MSVLNNPVVISIMFGIISILISFIENKVNNSNRNNKDYLKLFILVSISVLVGSNMMGNNSELASFKNQEILTGDPGF
jgi:hypothetical protein